MPLKLLYRRPLQPLQGSQRVLSLYSNLIRNRDDSFAEGLSTSRAAANLARGLLPSDLGCQDPSDVWLMLIRAEIVESVAKPSFHEVIFWAVTLRRHAASAIAAFPAVHALLRRASTLFFFFFLNWPVAACGEAYAFCSSTF